MEPSRADDPVKTAADYVGAAAGYVGASKQQKEKTEEKLNTAAEMLKEKTGEFVEAQKAEGAKYFDRLGETAHKAANELGKDMPELAGFINSAAENLQSTATALREHNIGDLTARFNRFARRQPAAAFVGSMFVGFALSRFLKSSPR